jgi:hypothetical protein
LGYFWLNFFDEAAQQGAVGGVGGGPAQALAGEHGAVVVGSLGQEQVRRLAVGESLRQLFQFAHIGLVEGSRAGKNVQKRGAGHGKARKKREESSSKELTGLHGELTGRNITLIYANSPVATAQLRRYFTAFLPVGAA